MGEKIDIILERYYQKEIDLLSVRKELLILFGVINSRLSKLEEENRLLKLIIENGLGAEDLENDCL